MSLMCRPEKRLLRGPLLPSQSECQRSASHFTKLVQRLRPFRSFTLDARQVRSDLLGALDTAVSTANAAERNRPLLRREDFKEKGMQKEYRPKIEAHTTWLRPRLVGEVKFTEWTTAAKCATRFWACAVTRKRRRHPRNSGMRVPDHMPCSTRTRPTNRPTTAFALRWHPAHRLGRYDGGLAELLAAALAVAALAWFAGPQ